MDGPDGLALKGFWERVIAMPEQGRPPIAFDWYRDFLTFMLNNEWYTWFSWLIALGEVAVGIALIIGVFTGLAALGGAFLNFNFLMAGTASTNPVLFVIALLIAFGWKTAGWVGVDRWLLPALGTPWQPGVVVRAVLKKRVRVMDETRPVCGTAVDPGRALRYVYNGVTHLPCCPTCKKHLEAEPARYLGSAGLSAGAAARG